MSWTTITVLVAAILALRFAFAAVRVWSQLRDGHEVFIPAEKEDVYFGDECRDWLERNTLGNLILHRHKDGRLHVTFNTKREGEAFQRRWLS